MFLCVFCFPSLTKDVTRRPKYRELLKHPFILRYEEKQVDVGSWLSRILAQAPLNFDRLELWCFEINKTIFAPVNVNNTQNFLNVRLWTWVKRDWILLTRVSNHLQTNWKKSIVFHLYSSFNIWWQASGNVKPFYIVGHCVKQNVQWLAQMKPRNVIRSL